MESVPTSGSDRLDQPVLRVLLVEDSPILGELLTRMLASEPEIDVTGRADTAPGAVEALRATPPDVVVLDLHLREGTGYDVLREANAAGSATTFVVLSNHAGDRHRRAALDAGARFFFDKSREIPALVGLLRKLATERA